ncbi:hypothetical protein ACFYUD_15265 [Nocardia tengchongensis]|uniref:Uncharacterized protein n=1 Tax=Nocardia tengchongensis TaxID=2055889 RepID=A0ABX8CTJ5_9NOCA|nr:hypothetical protein [Nocardia tengchongensis]QVI23218.1 hypothetical protein KHQ06_10090 [Nocardia tengchongensis]
MLTPAPDPRLHGRPELALLLEDLLRRAYRRWRERRVDSGRISGDPRGTE